MLKKYFPLVLVAFLLWYLVQNPSGLADAVSGIVSFIGRLFSSFSQFLTELTS